MCSLLIGLLLLPAPQLVDRTDRLQQEPARIGNISREKRADIYMARKMYREASETYRLAVVDQPGNARLHNKLGISYHQRALFADARKSYEQASRVDEKYAQAINNLGTIHYAQRKYKRAQKTYLKALKIAPSSASIYSNLGTAYFMRGKFKDASSAYFQALELDPNVFEQRGDAGTLLQERSVSDRAKYYYFVAQAYAKGEQFDRAVLYLRKSLEEGYGSRRKILGDRVFEPLHELPGFQALVNPGAAPKPPPAD